MGSTNTGCSKQNSYSLFFNVSYIGLKLPAICSLLDQSHQTGASSRWLAKPFHAYQLTAGFPLLYHTTTFPVWLLALFGVLWACYYMQFSLMLMIDLATVLCERCTSPEVLYNCRITLISSIFMFSNFFFYPGVLFEARHEISLKISTVFCWNSLELFTLNFQ